MNLVQIATADPDINEKLVQISGTRTDDHKVSQRLELHFAKIVLCEEDKWRVM